MKSGTVASETETCVLRSAGDSRVNAGLSAITAEMCCIGRTGVSRSSPIPASFSSPKRMRAFPAPQLMMRLPKPFIVRK